MRIHLRNLKTFSAVVALSLLTSRPLGAAVIQYPKDGPVFSLAVPDGWTAEEDSSGSKPVLTFISKDSKSSCQINLLPLPERGSETLAEIAHRIADATLRNNAKISEIKFGGAASNPLAISMAVGRESVKCKIEGVPSIFVFTVFNPVESQLFEAVLCNTSAAKDSGVNTLNVILRSIKPAGASPN